MRRHLRLARLKTDLVAAASHELRTPLASMRVLVDGLLADRELDPIKTRGYLELIATENARLSRLIDNFLTFARLDSRPLSVHVCGGAALDDRRQCGRRDSRPAASPVRARVDAPSDLPPLVADAEALCMALINLLDNAVKYRSGDTPISVRAASATATRTWRSWSRTVASASPRASSGGSSAASIASTGGWRVRRPGSASASASSN